MVKRTKTIFWVSNKELLAEIILCKANNNIVSDKLSKMIIKICKGVSSKMTYYNDDDRQDCLSEAYLMLFKNWYQFDESQYTNPFAYYTEIAKRAVAKGWNDLHKGIHKSGSRVSLSSWSDFISGDSNNSDI